MSVEPTFTSKAKRDALVRELRAGRKIPAYEMPSIAGLQYSRAVHELRWNRSGCVNPELPEGLEYGLNIQNGALDPANPDHTVFWLAPGHWTKPARVTSGAKRRPKREVSAAINRDDDLDDRRHSRAASTLPAVGSGLLFGNPPEEHHDLG